MLTQRVEHLEDTHDQHERLLMGFRDETTNLWVDGVFQTMSDIKHFVGEIKGAASRVMFAAFGGIVLLIADLVSNHWPILKTFVGYFSKLLTGS